MKKFWDLSLAAGMAASCLCLCQCGSLPGGKKGVDDGYDHIETIGEAEAEAEAAAAAAGEVSSNAVALDSSGKPPTDVEVDDSLDAAVFTIDLNGEKRNLIIQLNPGAAPQTVLNFKRNVTRGYYNGQAFHRVISNYLVQTGDPLTRSESNRSNWGTGGPGYTIPGEPGQPHVKGAVAMARLNDTMNPSRESSGSQFYIALRKLSKLDGDYTVFGTVTQGLDVLTELSKMRTDENDVPIERIEVESAKLVSSKSRFVQSKAKRKPASNSKPGKTKGGFEKFIDRIW
ncbi:MAG: cyclophilin family peptidyl-prolyl cis-trans isomerase [Verrucomicrobiales bacterium]|jgi:cyclophilin family peptidyl-prolyl cis-trans isomerase